MHLFNRHGIRRFPPKVPEATLQIRKKRRFGLDNDRAFLDFIVNPVGGLDSQGVNNGSRPAESRE